MQFPLNRQCSLSTVYTAGGTGYPVDTGCSSPLVAIPESCLSLNPPIGVAPQARLGSFDLPVFLGPSVLTVTLQELVHINPCPG